MILFDARDCFARAVDTAILINSVCKHVLNKHFVQNEVSFGIGIDYGRMLATKTGLRKHGEARQSYRSLVWLGRPANIASKLTDNANKVAERMNIDIVNVAYRRNGTFIYNKEWTHLFLKNFYWNAAIGLMCHVDQTFHSFTNLTESFEIKPATPAILMSKRIFDGFRAACPQAPSIVNNWFKPVKVDVPGLTEQVYGGNVIYKTFEADT